MAKVMLVEDDNNLREIYEARMQAEGYDIVTAHDGEEALVVAKAEQPDLIISDVMMPKISGFEMLDILRNTDGLKDVKVIMLTALGQSDDQERADRLGADAYLVKSQVTLEDIVKVAERLLGGGEDAPEAEPVSEPTPVAVTPVDPVAAPQFDPVAAPVAIPAPAEPTAPSPAPAPVFAAPVIETPVAVEPTTAPLPAPAYEPAPLAVEAPTPSTQPQPVEPTPVEAPAFDVTAPTPVQSVPAEPVSTPVPEPVLMPEPVAAPIAPAPAPAPLATPISTPAPLADQPPVTPQPVTEPVAPPEPIVAAPTPAPAPAPISPLPDAMAASDESADVLAQIEQFAASETPAPIEVTPTEPPVQAEPVAPEQYMTTDPLDLNASVPVTSNEQAVAGNNEDVLNAALENLSGLPQAPVEQPAPGSEPTVQGATEAVAPGNNSAQKGGGRVIAPLAPVAKPDLNTLLSLEEVKEQSGTPLPAPVVASAQVGVVPPAFPAPVQPAAGPTPGQTVDPNSIAL